MQLEVVELTRKLIAYPSASLLSNVAVTRCIADLLAGIGFEVEELPYVDVRGIDKLSLVARLGTGEGGLTLLGHDDVVPARLADGWTGDPFTAQVRQDKLYGRGACDMKGPLAAALCAAALFKKRILQCPLFFVVTADEEIQARGARQIADQSRLFEQAASGYGIICEPTRLRVVHAHKGALSMTVTAHGKAAHTSTLKGVNANINMIPFLGIMKEIYEQTLTDSSYGNEEFDPSHSEWSIGINDHNQATNMCPMRSVCTINYRPMPGIDTEALIEKTRRAAHQYGLEFRIDFHGDPVYTPVDSPLVRTALQLTGTRQADIVPYGTDGLALSHKMKQLVVIGPGDIAQAHTVDEWIDLAQLRRSVELYTRFIDHVCVQGNSSHSG